MTDKLKAIYDKQIADRQKLLLKVATLTGQLMGLVDSDIFDVEMAKAKIRKLWAVMRKRND